MKPIRLTTIGKVIWFFLVVIVAVVLFFIISLFKKDDPKKDDNPDIIDSETIIDYTESKNNDYNFDSKEGFKAEKDVITIKESGTYKLSGVNDTYKIVIDCPNGVVKVILSNFKTSVVYDLINIKAAHKVIFELEDGSENSIVSDLLEQEGVTNPTVITSNKDIEFIGHGKLSVDTIGNFLVSKANLNFKDATLEINSINNGIRLDGSFNMDSGNLYVFSSEQGFVSGVNTTINNGTFVLRSSTAAIKVNGIFLTNAGKIFIASLEEIQKPNANSLQKSIILNFKEARTNLLFFHDTTAVKLVYAGGLKYQHILYSDDFKASSYVLYGQGKVAGTQVYGLYDLEDSAEDGQLTCEGLTNDRFLLEDLVNVYDDIVKK